MIASPPPLLMFNPALLGTSNNNNFNNSSNQPQPHITSPTTLPNTKVIRQTPLALDTDTAERVVKTTKKTSSFFHLLANEPSLGLFHVQEHIRKNAPKLAEIKKEMRKKATNIEEITYDLNYSLQTIQSLHDLTTFEDIKVKLDTCIELIHKINRGQVMEFSPSKPLQPSTPQNLAPNSPPLSNTNSNSTTPNVNLNINTTSISSSTTSPIVNPTSINSAIIESYLVEGVDVTNNSSGSSGEEVASRADGTEDKEPTPTSPLSINDGSSVVYVATPLSADSSKKSEKKKSKTPTKQKPRAQRSLSNSFDLQPKQF